MDNSNLPNLSAEEIALITRLRDLQGKGEEGQKAVDRVFGGTERAIVRVNKDVLEKDEAYVAAKKRASTTYQTWNRTKNRLVKQDIPVLDENDEKVLNPETNEPITRSLNWYERRLESLGEQVEKIETEYANAAADTAEGDEDTPEGSLHQSMREAKARLEAITNKLLGIRPGASEGDAEESESDAESEEFEPETFESTEING